MKLLPGFSSSSSASSSDENILGALLWAGAAHDRAC